MTETQIIHSCYKTICHFEQLSNFIMLARVPTLKQRWLDSRHPFNSDVILWFVLQFTISYYHTSFSGVYSELPHFSKIPQLTLLHLYPVVEHACCKTENFNGIEIIRPLHKIQPLEIECSSQTSDTDAGSTLV